MAEVTNISSSSVGVTVYGLHFEIGETQTVADDEAETLPVSLFQIVYGAVKVVKTPVQPEPVAEAVTPTEPVLTEVQQAEADVAAAAAHLAAAQASTTEETK